MEQVFEFRYRIYVEEMNRPQFYADHTRRRIADPLDEGAYVIAAFRDGEVVGTIRTNFTRNSEIGYYADFYQMKSAAGEEYPRDTSIYTRLMIDSALRNTTLAYRICISAFEHALVNGIRFSFMDCNDHLVPFFSRFGWRTYLPPTRHPEYGVVNMMKFDLRDVHYMESLKSPCLYSLRALNAAHSDGEEFRRSEFGVYLDAPRVSLTNQGGLSEHIPIGGANGGGDRLSHGSQPV